MIRERRPGHASGFRRLLAAGLVCLGLVLGAGPARAQDPVDLTEVSLEDLAKVEIDTVYGASRYSQSIREAPASVTVVTRSEIAAYGHRTLADVLRSVMGLHTRYDRGYTYLGVRGFSRPGDYNSRVLLLVDGHRLNDSIYDQSTFGTEFPIDIELVDRVEVIRGPNASLYGTSALLAVVNVVTIKAGSPSALAGRFLAGSQGTLGGAVVYETQPNREVAFLVSGSTYSTDGQDRLYFPEFADANGAGGVADGVDGDKAHRFFANFALAGLRGRAAYGTRTKHFPTGAYDTVFGDPRTLARDSRGYVDLQYEKAFRVGTLTARGYFDHYRYEGTWVYSSGDSRPDYLNRDEAESCWWGTDIRMTTPPGRAHRGSIGIEFAQNLHQDQRNYDVEPYGVYLDRGVQGWDWALYGQDQWQVHDRLALSGSVRVDRRARFDWTLSPRAAVIADVRPHTTVKGIYARVFRFPNVYEQYYTDGFTQKTNLELEPEAVDTWEALLEQRFGPRLRMTAGTFLSRFSDLIDMTSDTDGWLVYRNRNRASARGLEFEAEVRQNSQAPPVARTSYSVQWSRDGDSGRTLTDSPLHLFKANAMAPLGRLGATAGLEVQFTSRRQTRSGSYVDGAWVTNLTLSRPHVLPGLDLTLGAYNLFDARYADPTSAEFRQEALVQDGRTVRVRLTYRIR